MRRGHRRVALRRASLLVPPPRGAAKHKVTVGRTAHGIPHITAKTSEPRLRLRQAIAEDNICVLADSYVTVRGERSSYFGPEGDYAFRGNGTTRQQPQLGLLLPARSSPRARSRS